MKTTGFQGNVRPVMALVWYGSNNRIRVWAGHKPKSFLWGCQKRIGKFQSSQV